MEQPRNRLREKQRNTDEKEPVKTEMEIYNVETDNNINFPQKMIMTNI